MEGILLLIENRRNRELLAQELEGRYRLLAGPEHLEDHFDLGVVDGPALEALEGRILVRREEERPVFLPFLFLTTRQDVGYATRHLWRVVEELICMPIEKVELVARVEILLRARRYSLEIKRQLEETQVLAEALGHDLRAPLRALGFLAEKIKGECVRELPEECRDYCRRMLRAIERLEALHQDLWEFLATGLRGPLRERVILSSFVKGLLQELEPLIQERKARVLVEGEAEVVADRSLLSRILRNLLVNALTYVPPERAPEVRVRLQREGNFVKIEVSDNGEGIPPEKQREIFQPFVRLHSADEIPGTGLGLSIVKKCVAMLRGECGVESEPGRGSTFWVRLPVQNNP